MTVLPLSLKKSEKNLLKDIAIEKKVDPSFIEKDYYFCLLLNILSKFVPSDFKLVFTGGTSLSKAYHLIDRFSEDCDILLIGKNLTRSRLSFIKESLKNHIDVNSSGLLEVFDAKSNNNNQNMTFFIGYEKSFNPSESLRAELKLEIIAKDTTRLETKNCIVESFLRSAQKRSEDQTRFECLAVEEILAGKVSALIWRYQTATPKKQNIRHLYDIALICVKGQIDESALKKIASDVVESDLQYRLKGNKNIIEACKVCIDNLKNEIIFAQEYEIFVQNLVYDSSSLPYEKAVDIFSNLAHRLFL